jgi:drug/metabolite transporter (DMT)-like permease
MHSKALAALFFTVIAWGVTPAFARDFALAAGPYEALLIRNLAIGIVFAVALALTTGFYVARADWPRLLAISIVGMGGYFLLSIPGFAFAPAGIGTLVLATGPLMIALLAAYAGTEKLTAMTILGLLVSFFGTGILFWGDNIIPANFDAKQFTLGCLLILASALCWSFYSVYGRQLLQKYGAIKITGLSSIIISVPVIPFLSASTYDTIANLNQGAIFSLFFLTFIGATLSVVTWNYATAHLNPTLVGSGLYFPPPLAFVAGWLLLGEGITLQVVLAGLIILAGVAIAQIPGVKAPQKV